MPTAGIEPRPPAWQASALSITPLPLGQEIRRSEILRILLDDRKDNLRNHWTNKALFRPVPELVPGGEFRVDRECDECLELVAKLLHGQPLPGFDVVDVLSPDQLEVGPGHGMTTMGLKVAVIRGLNICTIEIGRRSILGTPKLQQPKYFNWHGHVRFH